MAKKAEPTAWVGWSYFAGTLLLLGGGMQVIAGLAGIFSDTFYRSVNGTTLAFDFTTWGWIHLGLGVILMLAGVGVYAGKTWARLVATFLAVLSMLAHMAFLSAYPLWSLVAIVVDGFVIYALTMHGDELAE